jgi:pyruvate dehydrogenase E2 component (dihydrolipoamide acetyltransferase)
MAEFRMPSLGADMESGTLLSWLVKPGDAVKRGDIVAEVDTDKAVIDVETFVSGVVDELLVAAGTRVPVGTPLAVIREQDAAAAAPPQGPPQAARKRATEGPPKREPRSEAKSRRWASPLARHRAKELGLDLTEIAGTGKDGVITADDVARATGDRHTHALAEPPVVPPVTTKSPPSEPLRGANRQEAMRRAIGASMSRSKREIPHYYLATDIDASPAMRWLESRNAVLPVPERMLPAALLLKATALALHHTPELNGFWEDGGFRAGEGIHVGVAISLRGGGLVAPAIRDTDRATPSELMRQLRDLVVRARSGRLRSSEMSDPTITVTNLGDQGVDSVFPVIYPPQVAIVGFGRIREQPWASGGMVGVRQVVTATLAADHRVSDGHRGAVFLQALDEILQTPEEL